ncbi:MAG TPA: YkgJ family cysteine cluster protein [Planctomycetota bacterium]|nr:YkgJ family cysteine cluster protein [Planctomycetota bacterium]
MTAVAEAPGAGAPMMLAPSPGRFAFACTGCGRCCSNGSGRVWLDDDEIAPIAAAIGASPEAFARRHVRAVEGRLSLVETRDGRCPLLSDSNECLAYAARPRHCRSFPFWPSLLAGGDGLARARETCPGIHEAPSREDREAAYAELRALYARVDARVAASGVVCWMRGDCCDFPRAGHRLFATLLEVDLAAEHGPRLGPAERDGWCEMYRGGRCAGRETRPLACRTYFCDPAHRGALEALHEESLAELRSLERRLGYPAGYGDFLELLPARRAALALLDVRRGEA